MASKLDEELRIWIVLDLAARKRGSLEEGLVALARRLGERRVRATFVFSEPPIDWLGATLAAHGAEVRALDFRRPARAALDFARWLAAGRPALVHFHFVRAHSPLVLMAHAAGARVIVHEHITLGQAVPPFPEHSARKKALLRPLKRLRAGALDHVVDARLAVSLYVAASAIDAEFVRPERIEVVANGVDVDRFVAADGQALRWELGAGARPIVACVSRLSREKGVDVLVRAMARVPGDALLVVAGDGPDAGYCAKLAEEAGVAARVRFLGQRNDVENIYAAADVVVMPSRWDEAFGLCVVEAMAAGKPVVVTDSGAMPEIIRDGECGAVVPKGDDPAMARAISAFLTDAERARRAGEAARRRATERYPIDRWVDALLDAYARQLPTRALGAGVIAFDGVASPPSPPQPEPSVAPESAASG